jgi:hypothetical protein
MSKDFFVFDVIPIEVDVEKVLGQLGYPPEACLSPKSRENAEVQMAQTLRLMEPKGAYLVLEGTEQKEFELFSEAEAIVLSLATIGPAVEQRARELVNTEHGATGLIVDAIGTVAAEQTADFVERKIRQDCAGWGWKVSRRYSPGYCGWQIEAQREIFNRFPDTLGIKLTSSCLMIPEKSLSFACLLSTNGNFGKVELSGCKNCQKKDCPDRLEPFIV